MRTFDNFDEFADQYREIHNENIKSTGADSDYFAEYKILELKKHIKHEVFNFLDYGCGDGQIYKYFIKHFPKAKYIGIDISEDSINKAKSKFPEGFFLTFDGNNFPTDCKDFDIIFTSCVLHHINHDLHENVLSSIKKQLNNDGKLIIFEHNPLNPVTVKIVNECVFDEDAVLLKHFYLKKVLAKTGFKNTQINFTLFFPRHKIFSILHPLEHFLRFIPFGGQYYSISNK
jgi:SAM-dependent methyltransferase